MRTCKNCDSPVPHVSFGRPREYCDNCRVAGRYRPTNPVCPGCNWEFEGGGEWQTYCSDECVNAYRYPPREKRTITPLAHEQDGPGPWVWEVGERYAVTARNMYPRHGGKSEQIRCGIIADFPNKETAKMWVKNYTERLKKLRTF